MLKRFSAAKNSPVKIGPKNGGFSEIKGINIKYSYRDPQKALACPEDVFWRILRKNPFRGVGSSLIKESKKRRKTSHPRGTAKSRIWGAKTPQPIDTKFCIPGAIQDLITPANLCEHRLRGFSVAMGRILAFSIDLLRRL